jgi:peptidoglycan/LPS O-acetylase OafA/YrhL
MLFHSFLVGGLGPNWSWLSRFGWMGVDLFFVLSGFLIGTQVLAPLSQGRKLAVGDFYAKRAFRVLPAYWATLLMYWTWPAFREAPEMEPFWKFFTFFVNLSIDYGRNAAFSHAWSLCVEEHFYWLFPLLAAILCRRPSTWRFVAMCVAMVGGGIALRAAIWLHGMDVDPTLTRNWFIEDIYYPTWNRLDGLLCGVALAVWKTMHPQTWQRARRFSNVSLLAGLCLLSLAFWLFRDRVGFVANTVGWPVLSLGLGLLVFAGAGRDGLMGRLEIPLCGWIAAISYSLYLVHKPAYHLVQAYWGAQLSDAGLLAFPAYAITAILAGAALHHAVERPCLQLRKRLQATRPERPASNAA